MSSTGYQPFSWKWVVLSMLIFVGIEMILGGLVGHLILGRYLSLSLQFTLQGVLNLASYFVGGLLIGLLSPGLRIREPAVGAFFTVALMLSLSLFTPYSFIRFSLTKMVVGGIIAFVLALVGAGIGERVSGNRLPA